MMNEIAPFSGNYVSNRNIISPVRNSPSVDLNPYFSRSQNHKRENAQANPNHKPIYNTQSFNPFFAIHVLIEAGETEENDNSRGYRAYNPDKAIQKNVLAVA